MYDCIITRGSCHTTYSNTSSYQKSLAVMVVLDIPNVFARDGAVLSGTRHTDEYLVQMNCILVLSSIY